MKALLVTIPPMEPHYPPAILPILASCCETVGVQYEILDLNLYMYDTFETNVAIELSNDLFLSQFRSATNENNFNDIILHLINQIKIIQPTHLCMSIFSFKQLFGAFNLLRKLKEISLPIKIVIGGSGVSNDFQNFTTFGKYCLDNDLVDFCIFGDGEYAFMELLKGNYSYPGINQPNQKQILDLNSLPTPSYVKIDPKKYHYLFDPLIVTTGSKGCVRDCTFCNINTIWDKFVYKSGIKLAHELLKNWQLTGVSTFFFSDSLINGSIKVFREFNEELILLKKQYPKFNPRYKGQFICRPVGAMKEQDYLNMSLAGAAGLNVGIESFSNSVRNHMRKKFDNAAIDYHLELCAKYGIKNVFLLLSGYITETLEDHEENLRYLEKYQVYGLSGVISGISMDPAGLGIFEDTPLRNMGDDLQIMYNHNSNDRIYEWISLKNPDLTPKERVRRSAEVLLHATRLGYQMNALHDNIDHLERFFASLGTKKDYKKIPITS